MCGWGGSWGVNKPFDSCSLFKKPVGGKDKSDVISSSKELQDAQGDGEEIERTVVAGEAQDTTLSVL